MRKFIFTIMAALAIISCSDKTVGLQVETKQGVLEGFDQNGVKTFLGIPFAKSPVGKLRWQAPQEPEKWIGVRPAKEFGNDPVKYFFVIDMDRKMS